MSELESMACCPDVLNELVAADPVQCFDGNVRSVHAVAVLRLHQRGGDYRWDELARLVEREEQTRCQAFAQLSASEFDGPMRSHIYVCTVRSIIDKLIAKLEMWADDPASYQASMSCLSDYFSALNHHCDICTPTATRAAASSLPAISEDGGVSTDAEMRESGLSVSEDTVSVAGSDIAGSQQLFNATPTVDGPSGHHGGPRRRLSDAERLERRRESNKRAASKYRSKRTDNMQGASEENGELRQQVGVLTNRVAVLGAENELLKQQVAFLQNILQNQSCAAPPSAQPPQAFGMQ